MTRRSLVRSLALSAGALKIAHAGAAPPVPPSPATDAAPQSIQSAPAQSAPATDPQGPTGALAGWLASTTLHDIPEATRERARHLMLDGFGCLLMGAHLPWSETAVNALLTADPTGNTLVAGWNRNTSSASATLLNSSFIQGFELDDYFPAAPLHANAIILPALLAALPLRPRVTGGDLLLGTILGYETGTRVGLALHGSEMLTRGWHSGAVFGAPAAAAAVGKLYGFSAALHEDALGIAATQSCGLMSAQFESMVKRMQHGFAARNGFTAVVLAAGGYVGIKRVFEREYGGYLGMFGEGHSPDATQIALALGSNWNTDKIAVKPYAAMGALHAGIDAALLLRAGRPIDPEQVSTITVEVGEAAFAHGGFAVARPLTPTGAQMSLQYTIPVALLDGSAMLAQYAQSRINSDDVWALIAKTHVVMNKAFDRTPHTGFTTRVTLAFKDGTSSEQLVEWPLGTHDRPLSNAEIVKKYALLTDTAVDKARSRQLMDMVLGIEQLADASRLLPLLAPVVKPAL